ncbi:MAG: sulfotransferase [Caulobacterales bacterium]|jgi:tetratricopeptide (TPR) repeat protein
MASDPSAPPPSVRAIQAGLANPRLLQAAAALNGNDIPQAEALLRQHLYDDPFDVAAIRLFAEVAARIGRFRDSENLLRRALELDPNFTAARTNLATVLYRQNRLPEALAELDHLIALEPDNPAVANLKAATLGRVGAFEEAIALYEQVLAAAPRQPRVWMSYGHMLKTIARTPEGADAYRKALAIAPELGEAWWSLANLKTAPFSDADLAAMQAALARQDIRDEDRFHLDFAMGKALEDRKDFAAAFAHYDKANALRRQSLSYDPEETTAFVGRMIAALPGEVFANRVGQGCRAPDPIFVLGMPRAGSTLIEQILASHSQVEGTSELPDIPTLSRKWRDYPAILASLEPDELVAVGEAYLQRAAIQRRSDRPFFIDKLPNNWIHAGFIKLILPNAKIIDARRHPLSCCWSNFKQHFAKGQAFSYGLADMGAYYRDYVRFMAHLDKAAPGAVHRVIYERMVDDTETEIRALLAACGLPFEDACLRFHETERAVRTPSSEQVRRPIFRDGAEGWQGFAPYLGPLETALGDVLNAYPAPPAA